MAVHQQVQSCSQKCSDVANQLRTIANQAPEQRAREMLTFAAVHLEMCVHECDEAVWMMQQQQAVPQAQFQPQY